jgi:hypothetical protein
LVRLQPGITAQELRALGEQRMVADDDQVSGKIGLRQGEAQVRTDAGGFSGGDSDRL